MERKETTVIETAPEKKQTVIRRQKEFGWTLVSAQEDTQLTGGQTQKLVKLLFTRMGSAEWIEDMNHLEKEQTEHENSVTFGSDKLVILGDNPSTTVPIPTLIVILFAGYLVGWLILDIIGGVVLGPFSALVSWLVYRRQGRKKLQTHTTKRRKATETFAKKRHKILVRIRAHANTRTSGT